MLNNLLVINASSYVESVAATVLRHAAPTSRVADASTTLAGKIGLHQYLCFGSGVCPSKGFVGVEINIDTILMTIVVMAVVLGLALLVRLSLNVEKPSSAQNVLETVFSFITTLVSDTLGAGNEGAIGPLAVALFMFILVSNYIGLIPVPIEGWHAPTSDLNTTLSLALLVFVLVQILSIRKRHVSGYVKHYFQPYWWLFPINLIEEISKPITLSFRLFGNIFAGEVLLLVAATLLSGSIAATAILPFGVVLGTALGLFVGAIQAFIFSILMVSYVGIATAVEDH